MVIAVFPPAPQVYQSCPQTLLPVLPSLEAELKVDDVSRRLAAVQLLGRLFGQRGLDLDMAYSQLFTEFVRRFRDLKVRTRQCWRTEWGLGLRA